MVALTRGADTVESANNEDMKAYVAARDYLAP